MKSHGRGGNGADAAAAVTVDVPKAAAAAAAAASIAPPDPAEAKGDVPLEPLVESALKKITRRIVPLTSAVALMNHLDRSK